ncbi:MAG: hypothetical protein IKR38_02055 [Bacteroidales bacterium]|nr:hypothetical protein [Bacteroidales bacterium]
MTDKERIQELERKLDNMKSLLSYYRRNNLELQENAARLLRGAITTEYGAFTGLADEIIRNLEFGATKEHLLEICHKWLRIYLGSEDYVGILTRELNQEMNGIIDSLLDDYPDFGIGEANLFACLVIRIRDSILKETFGYGKDSRTAYTKFRLFRRIRSLGSRRYMKYLKLLGSKDCTLGKKLLSLHDLRHFSNGKPEKNKDQDPAEDGTRQRSACQRLGTHEERKQTD